MKQYIVFDPPPGLFPKDTIKHDSFSQQLSPPSWL